MYEFNDVVANPSATIYGKLPGEIPKYQSLVFISDTETGNLSIVLGTVGVMGTLMFVGLIVAVVTQPKPGSEALAMGLVTSVMMR